MPVESMSYSNLAKQEDFVDKDHKVGEICYTHFACVAETLECCPVASSTWLKCMGGLLKCNAVIVCTAENYANHLEQAGRHDQDRGVWNVSTTVHLSLVIHLSWSLFISFIVYLYTAPRI